MSEEISIEEFYRKASNGELYASMCMNCGKLSLPPRKICPSCFSNKLTWKKISNEGEIESFTIIHVAPKSFGDEVPYAVCLIRLKDNVKILARMKENLNEIKIGQKVKIVFKKTERTEWPIWPLLYAEKL
ncbi:MAG: Zn-ribbon domain-containing OB-fold protein [Thermoproteota archaeon]|jgi:uncharacterized OB-fold protein|nr:Zn-ribbon domain-containing OB-fold protein [Thermoproteota archaeon]